MLLFNFNTCSPQHRFPIRLNPVHPVIMLAFRELLRFPATPKSCHLIYIVYFPPTYPPPSLHCLCLVHLFCPVFYLWVHQSVCSSISLAGLCLPCVDDVWTPSLLREAAEITIVREASWSGSAQLLHCKFRPGGVFFEYGKGVPCCCSLFHFTPPPPTSSSVPFFLRHFSSLHSWPCCSWFFSFTVNPLTAAGPSLAAQLSNLALSACQALPPSPR